MVKILKLNGIHKTSKMDQCSKCGTEIENIYLEIGASNDDKEVKSVQLCDECKKITHSSKNHFKPF